MYIEVEFKSAGQGDTSPSRKRYLLKSSYGINADSFFVFTKLLVGHYPLNLGEQRIIAATANIGSRMNDGTELTNQNITGFDDLAAKSFHPAALAGTVTTVS